MNKMILPLKTYLLCIAVFSACQAQNVLEKITTVGQTITVPCGVQVKQSFTRLVWKRGNVTRTENLAYIYDGERHCDAIQKENCVLRPDGSLELPNVQETDSGDYFCVVDNEEYYSKHTLVVHPEVAFEGCPNSVVSVTQVGPDMKILAYTSPECKNADVVGIVSCDPPSGVKVGMEVTEINCTCTHSGKMTDICRIPIPVAFEGCPNSVVSVTQVGPDMKILAYTSPECKTADVVGIVSCDPPSGVKVGMEVTEINCTCTHSGKMTDICRIPIPDASPSFVDDSKSRLEPCTEAFCPVIHWFFGGIATVIGLGVLATSMVVLLLYKRKKFISAKPEVTEALLDKQKVNIGMQLELKCVVKGHPIPTVYWFKDGKQLASQAGYNTTFSKGVAKLTTLITNRAAEGIFLCIAVNSAGIASTSCTLIVEGTEQQGPPQNSVVESGRQPPILPVTAHQETTQNGAEELEMEPLMGENKTNRQPSDTRQKHVQQDTAVSTQASRRPLSAIKVTTNPEYPGQDVQSDDKAVTMNELMLDFQSGPRIKLLPLNQILSYGLEIRSPSDRGFKVIRKSEERYDVNLVCRRDGNHLDICAGDEFFFYVSCGHCNNGCLFFGISSEEKNLKETSSKYEFGRLMDCGVRCLWSKS